MVVHILSQHSLENFLDLLEPLTKQHPLAAKLFRFDHVDEVRRTDYDRLHRMGVIVCSNPAMLPEWRSENAFPMRSLERAGVRTCIGTDWVGEHNPPRSLSVGNCRLGRGHVSCRLRVGYRSWTESP